MGDVLAELHARCARGEPARPEETLGLISRLRAAEAVLGERVRDALTSGVQRARAESAEARVRELEREVHAACEAAVEPNAQLVLLRAVADAARAYLEAAAGHDCNDMGETEEQRRTGESLAEALAALDAATKRGTP
jgi:hypothetical protein